VSTATENLLSVTSADDIPANLRGTPIGDLLEYHNLNRRFEVYDNAKLLVGMCMDSRKHLHIPENFAYIIRSGGGNLRHSEFKVSMAISTGVRAIALLGHTNCRMCNLISRREAFITGLMENGGWTRDQAERQFDAYAPLFEIGDEVDFVRSEANRLRMRYPKVLVAPMIYRVEDNQLYLVPE
jgi:carbonic anhydrase